MAKKLRRSGEQKELSGDSTDGTSQAVAEPLESYVSGAASFDAILNKALAIVRATGGTLMLPDRKGEWLEIRARLGPPHPERQDDPKFRVGDDSIAGWVAKTRKAYLCSDVEEDSHFHPPRSGQLNFKSLLAVPIITGDTLVGVINADHERADFFTNDDRRRLSYFAEQVAGTVAEQARLHLILDSLHEVGASLTRLKSEGGLSEVLETVAQRAVEVLNIDLVTLYEYDQSSQQFLVEGTGPTIAGRLLVPGPMKTKIYPDDVPWKIVQMGKSRFSPDAAHDEFVIGVVRHPGEPERPRFVLREKIKSSAALVLRVGEEIVGIMFANYRTPHQFREDEERILETFANYAAIAIQNARHFEALQRAEDELKAALQLARDELKVMHEQRLAAEQIQVLGTIAGHFAHRLSNVAGTIPVAAQEIRRVIDAQNEVAGRYLQRIEEDGRRLLEMAEQLRKSVPVAQPQPADLNHFLADALKRTAIPDDIVVKENYMPNLPSTTFASDQMLEVFDNIIANAVEAMTPGGGELTLRTLLADDGKSVKIEIADTGRGMDEKVQKRLFSLFFTTKEKRGMGFGLWWCRNFVRAIGGDVFLKSSAPGKGSTFVVKLPIAQRS